MGNRIKDGEFSMGDFSLSGISDDKGNTPLTDADEILLRDCMGIFRMATQTMSEIANDLEKLSANKQTRASVAPIACMCAVKILMNDIEQKRFMKNISTILRIGAGKETK